MIEINLLPQEMRRQRGGFRLPKAALAGIAGVVVLVFVLGGMTYMQKARMDKVNADIARVEAKTQRMKKDIELVDRLVEVKTQIMRRLTAIETLDRNRGAWVENLEDLSMVIPDFLWLVEFRQGDDQKSTSKQRAGAQTPVNADSLREAKNRLMMKGYCYTVSSLANFILNLQDSPRFKDIQLKFARSALIKERRVYDFELACRLEPVTATPRGMEAGGAPVPGLGAQYPDEDEIGQDAYAIGGEDF